MMNIMGLLSLFSVYTPLAESRGRDWGILQSQRVWSCCRVHISHCPVDDLRPSQGPSSSLDPRQEATLGGLQLPITSSDPTLPLE